MVLYRPIWPEGSTETEIVIITIVCILLLHPNLNILLLGKRADLYGIRGVEGVWALKLVRKFRQCHCCHGQGPVVKIVHCDGRVKKLVTEEVTMK